MENKQENRAPVVFEDPQHMVHSPSHVMRSGPFLIEHFAEMAEKGQRDIRVSVLNRPGYIRMHREGMVKLATLLQQMDTMLDKEEEQ